VPRVASAVLLLLLVCATAVAFAVTEGLKLEPSPIAAVSVDKVVSPVCKCPTAHATIRFRLRKGDRLTIAMVDANGKVVQTLADGKAFKTGIVRVRWFPHGVRDGAYRPRVHLRRAHKTIVLPNPIRVDTKPPRFTSLRARPHVLEPGRHASVVYRLDEPARVTVYVDGRRAVIGRASKLSWKLDWYAKGAKPGAYVLSAVARDPAGNASPRVRAGVVLVPLRVVTTRVRTRVGATFGVRLEGDGRAYHWRLGGASGVSNANRLVLHAPAHAGRFVLVIRQDKLAHRVPVTVKP